MVDDPFLILLARAIISMITGTIVGVYMKSPLLAGIISVLVLYALITISY